MSDSIVDKIREMFDKQRYSEVILSSARVLGQIENNSDKARILFFCAKSNYLLGRNTQAFENITQVIDFTKEESLPIEFIMYTQIEYAKILRRMGKGEQSEKIYSSLEESYEDITPEIKTMIQHNLANLYMERGEFDRSEQLLKEVLEVDKSKKDEKGLSQTYSSFGALYFYKGEFDKAMEFYNKSLDLRKQLGDLIGVATLLLNIGSTYANQLRVEEASIHLTEAEDIFMELKHRRGVITTRNTMGKMYYNLQDYFSVISNLSYLELEPFKVSQIQLIGMLIEALIKNKQLERAEFLIINTLQNLSELSEEEKETHISMVGHLYHQRSQIKILELKYDEALSILLELEDIAQGLDDKKSLIAIYFSKAQVFYASGNLEESLKYAEESRVLALETNDISLNILLNLLFTLYLILGNYSKSYEILKELDKKGQFKENTTKEIILRSFQLLIDEKMSSISKDLYATLHEEQQILVIQQEIIHTLLKEENISSELEKRFTQMEKHYKEKLPHLQPFVLYIEFIVNYPQQTNSKIIEELRFDFKESKKQYIDKENSKEQYTKQKFKLMLKKIQSELVKSFKTEESEKSMLIDELIGDFIVRTLKATELSGRNARENKETHQT